MKRIDRETVQRIFDSANIVDVVSDFVSLKRRGVNYIGLCPFHADRSPSFYVSPAKNICKCFSCGKGGSPVNFIMEHEQMTYNEALRYLAKKYSIEIEEREMTKEEQERESARESMFAANEFALKHFERTLTDTPDGRDIGLAYFRERGITDAAIRKFHLGYSLERGNDLLQEATKAGFSPDILAATGLCIRRDDGTVFDRFKGRVIYPVHTISGKVVAFGGRTLRSDKKIAKYVNSPESAIYSKSRELYGLYQAKKSIVEKKKCILVEGYMDVISMSQLGIENVVASSGTSLTEGQIRLIHRFTDTVTVIYDSDAAGIKASLRGINMLLADGLKIKVVLLPDGDDPDSFAQSHSLSEVEDYLKEHETDFIRFKTDILLKDAAGDPIRRSQAITDIVGSIAVIPDEITRSIYTQECARSLDIDEKVLLREIAKQIAERKEHAADDYRREKARASISDIVSPSEEPASLQSIGTVTDASTNAANASTTVQRHVSETESILEPYERELIRYIIRYGLHALPFDDENGQPTQVRVIDYISDELSYENIEFSHAVYSKIIDECREIINSSFEADLDRAEAENLNQRAIDWNEGQQRIAQSAQNLQQIKSQEETLKAEVDNKYWERNARFLSSYLIRHLSCSSDPDVRSVTTELGTSRHKLSKYHSKFSHVETEQERLFDLLPRAIYGLKNARLSARHKELQARLSELSKAPNYDPEATTNVMLEMRALEQQRREYASLLGDRVVLPK